MAYLHQHLSTSLSIFQKETTFRNAVETTMMAAFNQLSEEGIAHGNIILHHELTNRGAHYEEAEVTARGLTDFVVFSRVSQEGWWVRFALTNAYMWAADLLDDTSDIDNDVDDGPPITISIEPATNSLRASSPEAPNSLQSLRGCYTSLYAHNSLLMTLIGQDPANNIHRQRGESEHDDASSAANYSVGAISLDSIILQERGWRACTIELKQPKNAFNDAHVREGVIQAASMNKRGALYVNHLVFILLVADSYLSILSIEDTQRFWLTSGRRHKVGILQGKKYHLSRQLRIKVRPAEIVTLMKEWVRTHPSGNNPWS
jgi:hypothetical protein